MNNLTTTWKNVWTETKEASVACAESLNELTGATAMTAIHTTQLTAKAAYIAVDTVDYGIKATIDAMPDDAEDMVNRGSVLISAVLYDLENTEDAAAK